MDKKSLTVVQMLPALDAGGVERGTLETAKNLVAKGHRSIVISAGGRMLPQLLDEGSEHYCWDVGAKRLGVLLWIGKVRALLEEIKPEILHLRSRLPAWIGYLAWKKMNPLARPHLVTTVHGPYTVGRYSSVMTRGERVIAISHMIKNYIAENYPKVAPADIRIVFRGVDRQKYFHGFRPTDAWLQCWKQDFPELENKFLLTLPARITRWKGQEDFIKVIKNLIDRKIEVHGLIVGEPHKRKQKFLQNLKDKITDLGLENHITFVGHRSDLKEIMSISKVVLSLALDPEAFGRTTIEALSLGIPVAGYNHGGVKEQLEAVCPQGAVTVGDTDAMAALLYQWTQQTPPVKNKHEFTLENMLSKTLAVYDELANTK